jgi:AAA family ATP:ADP antiporter
MFCLLFNYTLVRNLKDTLIVTAKNSGAEVITFVKVWLVFPAAIVGMVLIDFLSSRLARKHFFFTLTFPFFLFFLIHGFILMPHQDFFHPDPSWILSLQQEHAHFRWVFPLLGNWINVLFYVFAEMWGTACFYYLFWQVANQTTTSFESTRFFSLFGVLGNAALVAGGRVGQMISSQNTHLKNEEFYLISQKIILCFSGSLFVAYFCFFVLFWFVLPRDRHFGPQFGNEVSLKDKPTQHKKSSLIRQQIHLLFNNVYIKSLVLIYFSYGFLINILESLWKNQVKFDYPNPSAYNSIMGKYSEATGWGSIVLMFMGGWIIRKKGWRPAALATPLGIFFVGGVFVALTVYRHYTSVFSFLSKPEYFGLLVVFVGFVVNVFTKATKYSFFEPSRELVYTKLNQEMKSRGKVIVDLLGGRSGKAAGSLFQQTLLLITAGTQLSISPFTACLFLIVSVFWIRVIFKLDETLKTDDLKKKSSFSKPVSNSSN